MRRVAAEMTRARKHAGDEPDPVADKLLADYEASVRREEKKWNAERGTPAALEEARAYLKTLEERQERILKEEQRVAADKTAVEGALKKQRERVPETAKAAAPLTKQRESLLALLACSEGAELGS